MGQVFSRFDLLKSPKKPKGPPRRPPSAISRTRRSAAEKKATVDVSKSDLDSVTAEVETVLQNPNKNRAQRPQNRRPPARARQNRAESSPNVDTLNKAHNDAINKKKPEPPETKKPLELCIEKPDNFTEVDAIHHRLSEKKFLIPPTNNSVERQLSGGVMDMINTEDGTESETSNDTNSSKKKQRKSSIVFGIGRSVRKSFRKSLDKIANKRENKSREHSIDSAYSGKDDDSIMSNSMEIIDEQNNQQKNPESPAAPLLANPNLMLELNAKIGMQRSSELSEKSGTPPPVPSSPKPAFKDGPPSPSSLSQEQKPKSKIPRFSRSDSLVRTDVDDSGTTVNTRRVSTSKIPKLISVNSSQNLISPLTVKSENQRVEDSVDKIEDLKTVQKTREQEVENHSEGLIIQPGSQCDDLRGDGGKENRTKKLSSRIRPQAKLMSSSTIPKIQNKMSSEENLIQSNKTETKNHLSDSNKSVDVTNEDSRNSRRSSIPKLMSTTQKISTLPIPEDLPRPVSLPSVMRSPGKVSEKKETSSETGNIGLLLQPRLRKLSDSKIPQPVDLKNKSEDLKPANAKATQNKEPKPTLTKREEELNDSKVSVDDKMTNQQMPEIEDRNDSKNSVVLKVPGTKKRSVPSMMLDDALSEFQKEAKLADEEVKE